MRDFETIALELFEAVPERDAATSLRQSSRSAETERVRAMLEVFGGDRDAACRALGISKTTLWRKLNARP